MTRGRFPVRTGPRRTAAPSAAPRRRPSDAVARGLGWFSIGLGLAELVAPRRMAKAIGMAGSEPLLVSYGVRELATGVGLLVSPNPAPFLWGRVAGDALDLATLGGGMAASRRPSRVSLALAAVAGITVVDILCAQTLGRRRRRQGRPYFDYGDRTGFPRGADAVRGAARDVDLPRDVRIPESMRPYPLGQRASPAG